MTNAILCAALLAIPIWTGPKAFRRENRSMKTVVNNLGAEVAVTSRVKSDEDLGVVLTLTNESHAPFRLNATSLDAPSLIFRVTHADGSPAPMGPPPMPKANDGETGRVVLRPGEPFIEKFSGTDLFISRLKPGRYSIYFTYVNGPDYPGEWAGSIETKPVEFEVAPDLPVLR